MADLRARRRRGELAPGTGGSDMLGDVFLVVDGWHAFRSEHEGLEQTVISLATGGLSYGVHVVITASRWAELRPALKDLLGTRFELRLGDPSESEVDRRVAAVVPSGRPGAGSRRTSSTSSPPCRVSTGSADTADLGRATGELVARVAAAWSGTGAPRVRLLPGPRRGRVAARPGRRPAAPAAAGTVRGAPRAGPARRRRRPALRLLRRRRVGQDGAAAGAGPPDRHPVPAGAGPARDRRLPALAARRGRPATTSSPTRRRPPR